MINKKVAEADKNDKETIGGPAGSVVGRGASAVGGALKSVGTAFKKDLFKNAGEIENIVDAVWDRLSKDPEFMRKYADIKDKFDKTKKAKDIITIVKQPKDRKELIEMLASLYGDKYRSFKNGRAVAEGELKKALYKGNSYNQLTPVEKQNIDKIIAEILDLAFNNITKSTPNNNVGQNKKIPEGNTMSFKTFFESEQIKEEDNINKLDAEINKDKIQLADKQVKKAKAIQKITKDNISKKTNKETAIAEGVYAGGDGINKKIPFTQDPLLKKAEDSKEKEDPIKDAGEERRKRLEKITKELQELANEVSSDINPNIHEEPPLDALAAKEKLELAESCQQWEQMQANLGECGIENQNPVEITAQNMIDSGEFNNYGFSPESKTAQVADRSSIYGFIKSNNLTKCPRDQALEILLSQFGNSSTELSQIFSDAVLSDGEPSDISASYGYTDSLRQIAQPEIDSPVIDWENSERGQLNRLQDTWKDMEAQFKLKDL